MIRAGKVEDIRWANREWLIPDIGFSNREKSCGILLGDEISGSRLTFKDAKDEVIKIAGSRPSLSLVIEAPLSVAFDKIGNPTGRSIEREGEKSRLWYVGPGSVVMVATMYLLSELHYSHPSANVKLFEGFVSFKDTKDKSAHLRDVQSLRNAIKKREFVSPDQLKLNLTDNIVSAFKVMNMDLGIPPVIKVDVKKVTVKIS